MSLRDAIYGESASAARGCDGRGCPCAGTVLVRTRRGSLWCCPEHERILRAAGEVIAFEAPPAALPKLERDRPRPVGNIYQKWGSSHVTAQTRGAAGAPPELDRGPAPAEVRPTDSAGAERPDDKGPFSTALTEDSMPLISCRSCGTTGQSKGLDLCARCYNRAYSVLKAPLSSLDPEVVLTAARSKAGEAPAVVTAAPADPPIEAQAAHEDGRASTGEDIARLTRELASARGLLEEARLYIDATPPDEDGGMGSLEASLARDIDKEIASYTVFYTPPDRQIGRAAQRVRDLAQTAAHLAHDVVRARWALTSTTALIWLEAVISARRDAPEGSWQRAARELQALWMGRATIRSTSDLQRFRLAQMVRVDADLVTEAIRGLDEKRMGKAMSDLAVDMERLFDALSEAAPATSPASSDVVH